MNKEEILLKNYSILIKDPKKNADHIRSIICQLCPINPKLAIRCWRDIIFLDVDKLLSDIEGDEYKYKSLGYIYVTDFESGLLRQENFKFVLDEFSKDKQLLEVLYTRSPIASYFRAYMAIGHLIRNNKLTEANNILSAIYKNKTFKQYGELWDDIIDRFHYSDLDNYSGGGFVSDSNFKKEAKIQEFCMSWAERILNEEEKAIAVTHIMRIF